MGILQSILKNFGALFTGRVISILQQVVVPPIFIALYSADHYGEWLSLSASVAALGMLNMGVQTFMNQDLAVRYNRGEHGGYQLRQSTALRLLAGMIAIVATLCLLIFAIPLDTMMNLKVPRAVVQWAAYLLCLQVLLNILFGYLTGIYMGVNRAYRGTNWSNLQSLLASLGLLAGVLLRLNFAWLAGIQLFTLVLCMAIVLFDLRRTAPDLFPTMNQWESAAAKEILSKSSYFFLITMCTFLTYQAPVLILQRIAGGEAVAVFSIMRTVFSMCRQILAMFTQSMGPDITNLFGRNDWAGLYKLYDQSERLVFFLIPVINTSVLVLSPVLIALWIQRHASAHHSVNFFSVGPYVVCAAISMVISLKEHKFQFQFSTNTHETLALIMFFSYLGMVIVSLVTIRYAGIMGLLWTWLAFELLQTVLLVRLNIQLFAHIERLELIFLRRLLIACTVLLLLSFAILHKTATLQMAWQLVAAVCAGLITVALSWRLFDVSSVAGKLVSRFKRA